MDEGGHLSSGHKDSVSGVRHCFSKEKLRGVAYFAVAVAVVVAGWGRREEEKEREERLYR